MRRSRLTRRTPLTAKTPLKARSRLKSTSRLGKPGKSTDAYTAWQNAVWSRDLGVCQAGPGGNRRIADVDCSGGVDAHHVWPQRGYPERRLDVDNGVILCRAHHNHVHSHPLEARQRGLLGP